MWGRNESLSFPPETRTKVGTGYNILAVPLSPVSFLFSKSFPASQGINFSASATGGAETRVSPKKGPAWAFDSHRRSYLSVVGPRKSSGLQKPNRTKGGL